MALTVGIEVVYWLLSQDSLAASLGDQSFSKWEGRFFGYPEAEGWRPHFLKSLIVMALIPSVASLCLRRALPAVLVSRSHGTDYLAVLACQIAVLTLFHWLGADEMYGDWGKAVAASLPCLLFLVMVTRLPLPTMTPVRTLPGVSLLAAMLVAWTFVVVGQPSAPVAIFLFNFLFIGLAEEYAFRGVIQGWLLDCLAGRSMLGVSAANLITAVLFASIHNPSLQPEQMPWLLFTFFGGLVYGVVRERTGTWLASGLAHGCNAFYFLFTMLWPT